MKTTPTTHLVREGHHIAEVDVTAIDTGRGWSPDLGIDDMEKIDAVRLALRRGDLATAVRLARVYELRPVSAP